MTGKTDDDLISIIMPAYNCEKYISQSIKSVLNQTYKNFELIIIDDCSKDNTSLIIEEYLKVDKRIKFYKNEVNKGVSTTRNRGISLSMGDWIAFLDSDDLWDENKLEKQLGFAHKSKAEFTFTGSSFINEDSEPYNYILTIPNEIDFRKLLKQNIISCSSVLIKKHLIESYKMERDDIHEDYGSWLKILKSGIKAYGLNAPLLRYRVLSNSKSGNKLNSLIMNYKTYRFVGLNILTTLYYLSFYIVKGLIKYKRIKYNSL